MAVSMDGFSIRGYTAKMRSVDVVKCWPFNDSTNEDHVRAILPPITVKKFRWWLDVLQESVDNVDDSDVVPLGNIRKAKAFKGKARVQKKRSIIDIFAVAPQVERLDDVDYYDDDDDDDCATLNYEKDEVHISAVTNLKSKKRDPNKKKKTSGSKLKEVKKLIKKDDKQFKQKKKVKTNNCLDLLISNKEKLDKLKVPNSLSKPSCSQHNKKRGNEADWKPQRKLPVSEKKTKSLANSKCSAKHQKMAIPVCNKVKKRTKRYPVENSISGNSCGPNDSNLCNNQQVDKPVTFSDHGTRERGEVLSLVGEKGTNRYIVETTDNEDNEVTARPGSPKQLSIVCSTADISAKDNSVEFCDIFNQVAEESDNSNLFRRGYWVASNGSQYICNSACHHMPQEMHKKDQLVGSLINASCANEISHEQLKGSIREVAGICSMHSPTITGNCNGRFMQYQPFHQVSPQDLMCKICSSSERKHRESIYGENRNEEDYVSLPLNSQGELVNPNSNGKRKLTQQSSSRGIVTSSNEAALSKCMDNLSDGRGWDRQTPPTHQLKLSFVDDSMEWSPTFPVPSRLGIYDYDAGRTNVELDPLKETEEPSTPSELNCNVSNLSSHRSKQDDQPETNWSQQYGHSDQVSLLVTPSKMRLMGKEFTVGRRDFHVPQDKGIWTDKRIIAENFPAGTYNYNSVVTNRDRQMLTVHPVLGTLKGPVSCSPSIHINQAIPSSRVCTPHFSHQIDSVQPHCLGAINQNPFSFYNQKPPNFEEPCIGEYRSLSISPYAPLPASIHHYSCQNGFSNSVELNSSRCAINFPLLRLESGTGIQSHESTPWLSKKLQMELPQLNSASSTNHQYCSFAGDNRQIDPLVSFAPERFCSLTQCPQPSLENPVASPHLASYPPMPLHIGSRQNVGTNKRNGGDMMKLKEKIISTPCLRDPRHSKMAKRTLLSESYSCTNSTKIPNLGFREEPPVGLTPFHSDFEGHFNCRQAFESGSVKGMADNIQSGQRRTLDARFGSFDGEVTFKYNCPLKSGPVRLIPGAKHVLRPCQYNDQNFWPAHSTIPFDASTAGSRTLETAKPTKIYKF